MSFSERIVAGTIFGYDWFSLIGGIGELVILMELPILDLFLYEARRWTHHS